MMTVRNAIVVAALLGLAWTGPAAAGRGGKVDCDVNPGNVDCVQKEGTAVKLPQPQAPSGEHPRPKDGAQPNTK